MDPNKAEDADVAAGPELSMQRSRWATRKLTVKSSAMKRLSLLGKLHDRKTSTEKKRASGGSESLRQSQVDGAQEDAASVHSDGGPAPRQVYFNLPLPDDLRDQDGNPSIQYPRNKIRTAKYTPLSFVPKNLWFQFHNVANIFFLFLVILNVSGHTNLPLRGPRPAWCRCLCGHQPRLTHCRYSLSSVVSTPD